MEKEIFVFVLRTYPIFGKEYHIEHFNPHTKKWKKCESTNKNPCPFELLPHKLAYDGISCDCGKTMEEFLKRLEGVISMKLVE